MGYRLSADTGGTFIDVVITDERGRKAIGKALTTHDRAWRGMNAAVEVAAAELGVDAATVLADTDLLIYGTTRATNAIVTRNAAKTALLTTHGFPDVLTLREGGRLDASDFTRDFPEPYIPRRDTFQVPERIGASGEVVKELDEASVRDTLRRISERGYEAIAVCLLWSIVEPAHELAIARLIEEVLPGTPYSLSHRVAPIVREYRRASATAIDASLKPLMQEHLGGLEADLRAAGYAGEILVSTSIGGVMDIEDVIAAPVNTAKSGPSMAPIAAIAYSAIEGLGGNTIVCDTGGTTFDVGLSRGGRLVYSRETWLGPQWEGDLLGTAAVDIRSVGAGGGSIAWVDSGGLLRVGPQSAGSEPGPACYGRGGTLPTVSDAACVLGYFNPDFFLGGRMPLDAGAARTAVAAVADAIGVSIEDAAWGILTLSSQSMVKAVQEITVARGIDPTESTLVAGGGAAGMNIAQIAHELGTGRIVFPRFASALSATGMQFADVVNESSRAFFTRSDAFDFVGAERIAAELQGELTEFRDAAGIDRATTQMSYVVEARYESQVWDVETDIPDFPIASQAALDALVRRFHDTHESIFAVRDESSTIEFLNWRAKLSATVSDVTADHADATPADTAGEESSRPCYFGNGFVDTRIVRGGRLRTGERLVGPAIIEEPTTTLVVYPGTSAELSPHGNYVLHIGKA